MENEIFFFFHKKRKDQIEMDFRSLIEITYHAPINFAVKCRIIYLLTVPPPLTFAVSSTRRIYGDQKI